MMRSLIQPSNLCALLFTGSIILGGNFAWGQDRPKSTERILFDFNSPQVPDAVTISNGTASILPSADNNRSLSVKLKSKDHLYTALNISPEDPWNWQQKGTVGIAMDIGNPGPYPVQLYLDVTDKAGQKFTRGVVIPVGAPQTYYAELQGDDIDHDTGLRENPPSWDIDGQKFIWLWGTEKLNLSAITKVSLSTKSLQFDRQFTLDNVRLITNPKTDPDYLSHIVDKYGQSAKINYPLKIHSDAELKSQTSTELQSLAKGGKPSERSTYGGWKDGPKLNATGYFRTEKYNGKWAIIDPEGYLFFSTGVANIRLDNTVTMTGVDFDRTRLSKALSIETKDPSAVFNQVPRSVLKTRTVSSEIRHNMFEWLPDYNDTLANHYGYRNGAHTGPIKRGETYGFYSANLERKYGEASPKSFLEKWQDVTVDRMLDWGFTSFGNWADPAFYENPELPYFANGWITGDYKTVSSGDDYWAPLPDPFDLEFERQAKLTARKVAGEVKDNPWCIGVFIDNEKSWGRMGTVKGQYGIVINTLSRNGFESPTKAEFTRLLKEKYKTIEVLNAAWSTNIKSWKKLNRGIWLKEYNAAQKEDFSLLLKVYADKYFEVVDSTLNDVMPNHMYLGVRFATWGMTPEVIEAAAEYTDIISYNEYQEIPHHAQWSFLNDTDKPALIGEFHMGASSDTGVFHPGLIHAVDQADRARMYTNYMTTIIDNPNFVGAHWFQYTDSPITGRAYDGENYNVGFVSVTDTPYPELVEAAKAMNNGLYKRRFGSAPPHQD